jgi:SpoU rRNA methylase family enzyme
MRCHSRFLRLVALFGAIASAGAATAEVKVTDVAGDGGTALKVTWAGESPALSLATWAVERTRTGEEIRDARVEAADQAFKAARKAGESVESAKAAAERAIDGLDLSWLRVDEISADADPELVIGELEPDAEYGIRILGLDGGKAKIAEIGFNAKVKPQANLVAWERGPFGAILGLISTIVIIAIVAARHGVVMRIRKIAALEAIDEAVGRATEMGRPVLFVPGIQDMNDLQTVAGITVLGRVAKVAAEYDAALEVPTSRSLVMTAARDTVQAAYLAAGRGDAYNADRINYITDEQFGYVAYLAGTMNRERPATCLYMGAFYAESLLLAENGNSIGAIQIAGTAESSQLPFFVAACDYTLIGEEFFAASAYLSGEPMQLGSLFGQDLVKIASIALLIVGVAVATVGSIAGWANVQDTIGGFLGMLGS